MIERHNLSESFPEYWEELYKCGDIQWDLGGHTPIFNHWINKINVCKKICVLGAGNGWDAINFALKGHTVTAVDFALSPINNMKRFAKANAVKMEILHLDIFDLPNNFENYFDIVVESTCFCAIDPNRRLAYVEMVNHILKTSGNFVGILFPLDLNKKCHGPPYYVDLKKTLTLFGQFFIKVKCNKPSLSIESRKEREIFFIYKKDES